MFHYPKVMILIIPLHFIYFNFLALKNVSNYVLNCTALKNHKVIEYKKVPSFPHNSISDSYSLLILTIFLDIAMYT